MRLNEDIARRFAQLTLSHLGLRYPYKLDLTLSGPQDLREPADLHPIFHGSYDWHSCVHGWWQVLRLARLYPDMPEAAEIHDRADAMLVPEKAAGELARLDMPYSAGFERPYGWTWLLALHEEAARHDACWGDALEPLARRFAKMLADYLPKLTYPIRTGTHFNTAFALVLAHGWAQGHDRGLAALVERRAMDWFGDDRDCQAWEPAGDEFLSPALIEALIMATTMRADAFATWFDAFLPAAAETRPATLFEPATVSDRSDGKIAHLDGLNFSRAWCWRRIAQRLAPDHGLLPVAREAADRHLAASLPHIADDYMGSHWFASFALLALENG